MIVVPAVTSVPARGEVYGVMPNGVGPAATKPPLRTPKPASTSACFAASYGWPVTSGTGILALGVDRRIGGAEVLRGHALKGLRHGLLPDRCRQAAAVDLLVDTVVDRDVLHRRGRPLNLPGSGMPSHTDAASCGV